MFLTVGLFAKRAKAKHILVFAESMVSGHRLRIVRERLADKLEFMHFDPFIRQESMYRELKKIRNLHNWKDKKVVS